ncbi:MAG: hypothetical protein HYR62_09010 [Actinobacteria bacterium]|nr:hypothetical protein [Actinomycetota bacterium]MBI3688581.1 hypothetical protein [Actinomycetota bacterium]
MNGSAVPPARRIAGRSGAEGWQASAPAARSTAMLLMYEELARARTSKAVADAERYRRRRRLLLARRWQRRADEAARRARLAQTAVW